ncbi:hypothetical protein EVAR_19672_1 [Eumeta japonica]|uniref:Uncharacterized protein n=1 Tax=Eumeta variegata TaxID=151549 RepID=A0A4C1V2Q7_EUMVA|nr:hypothetical protein EVAR_19672_1 [Eumeta japonica]
MDGSGLEVQVGWRWLPAFSMHSKLMPVPNGTAKGKSFQERNFDSKTRKDAQKKIRGLSREILSKPENRETECQENVGVASTSAALNLEVMEVSEERNISPLEEDFSKTKTRESTAEEPGASINYVARPRGGRDNLKRYAEARNRGEGVESKATWFSSDENFVE